MLVAVVTDIGLASVLIDLFMTVVDVGAVVARTRKTGTSKENRFKFERFFSKEYTWIHRCHSINHRSMSR